MAINELSFNQLSTVLKDITDQATGADTIKATDTASFVSVANTALLTGYDNILQSISQVLSRTIFSVRPYNAKFAGLNTDPVRWGNHIRKLNALDLPFEEDDRMKLVDGQSIDQYVVRKPGVLQTNYYGENVFQKSLTIFRDQLDVAFTGPDEFGRFISMIMTNASDQIEQAKEGVRRATLCNLMGGVMLGNATGGVKHLVTEYNDYAGTSLTSETVMQPDNWPGFVRWLVGELGNIIDKMGERTQLYQINITDKPVMRHTPKDRLKVYLNSKYVNHMEASAFSTTFHDDYLKNVDFERVTYWQSVDDTTSVNLDASYITAAGAVTHGAVEKENIFGVMFDEEAAMVCPVNEWSARSPFNARGGYSNIFWHFTQRYLNDFTEKCVVLLLD